MTKTKVTEKLRSGASVPLRPDQTTTQSSPTPIAPASTSVTGLITHREIQPRTGRQFVCSNRDLCQASDSPTKETIRTSEAAQANSQAGIGRSWRPTSAWPTTRMPCRSITKDSP